MNKRGGYGTRCGTIDGVAVASEVSNVIGMIQIQQVLSRIVQLQCSVRVYVIIC